MDDLENQEQMDQLRKRLKETTLGINRVPKQTKSDFTQLADCEFESDYGMTLKFLIDKLKENSIIELISAKVIEIDQRISELETKEKVPQTKKIRLASGRIIEKKE